jgi:hypothetical protein
MVQGNFSKLGNAICASDEIDFMRTTVAARQESDREGYIRHFEFVFDAPVLV